MNMAIRDMGLVRAILLWTESRDLGTMCRDLPEINGFTEEQIGYHCKMMRDAGLIEAYEFKTSAMTYYVFPQTLTWEGHEFLDGIRSEAVWSKAKETAQDKGIGLTISSLKMIVEAIIKGIALNPVA